MQACKVKLSETKPGDVVVITRGIMKGKANILFVYLVVEWEEFAERLRWLPKTTNEKARKIASFFEKDVVEATVEEENEVVVPEYLIEYLGGKERELKAYSLEEYCNKFIDDEGGENYLFPRGKWIIRVEHFAPVI